MRDFDSELLSSASGAKAPWNSSDAMPTYESGRTFRAKIVMTEPDMKEIEACLRCPYPECHNCFDYWKSAFANIRYDTHKNRKKGGKRRAGL